MNTSSAIILFRQSKIRGHVIYPSVSSGIRACFVSTDVNQHEIAELITQLRSKKDLLLTPDKYKQLLTYFETKDSQWSLLSAYLFGLERTSMQISLEDLFEILERILTIPKFRSKAELMEPVRRITLGVTAHGVSSFSLDAVLRYARICEVLKVQPEDMFIDAICLRVSQLADSVDMAIYLMDLNGHWPRKYLRERISNLSESVLAELPLKYLAVMEPFCSSAFTSSLSNHYIRPLEDLLTELKSIKPSSSVFKAIASVCDERVFEEPNPRVICMYLSICTKREDTPNIAGLFDRVLQGGSPQLLPGLLRSMAMLGIVLSGDTLHLIALKVSLIMEHLDLETWLSVLESLAVLGVYSVELVGPTIQRAEFAFTNNQDASESWWKFALWWRFAQTKLGSDSIFHGIAAKQFPTVSSSIAKMRQPPTTNYGPLVAYLRKAQITHTANAVVSHSPLRSHAMLTLPTSQTCYVFLTRDNGTLIPVCNDSRVSKHIIKQFVEATGAKLCLIPRSALSGDSVNILELVNSYLVA